MGVSTAMPRYYFHITNGQESLDNSKGMDLPGNAAAREEAVVLASELRHGKVKPGRSWQGWFVSGVDQHGHKGESRAIADMPDEAGLPFALRGRADRLVGLSSSGRVPASPGSRPTRPPPDHREGGRRRIGRAGPCESRSCRRFLRRTPTPDSPAPRRPAS